MSRKPVTSERSDSIAKPDPYGLAVALNAGAFGLTSLALSFEGTAYFGGHLLLAGKVFIALFGLTMSVYNADRWNEWSDRRGLLRWMVSLGVHKYATISMLICAPTAIAVLILAIPEEGQAFYRPLALLMVLLLAGFAYSGPFPFTAQASTAGPATGLRSIPFIKSIYVSLVWSLAMLLPSLVSNLPNFKSSVAFAFFVLLLVIPGCNAGDIRDVKTDCHDGIKTFPVVLGVSTTIVAMMWSHAAMGGWILLSESCHWLPPSALVLLINCGVGFAGWHSLKLQRVSAPQLQRITFVNFLLMLPEVLLGRILLD